MRYLGLVPSENSSGETRRQARPPRPARATRAGSWSSGLPLPQAARAARRSSAARTARVRVEELASTIIADSHARASATSQRLCSVGLLSGHTRRWLTTMGR